jgi:hypothetical protein
MSAPISIQSEDFSVAAMRQQNWAAIEPEAAGAVRAEGVIFGH